MEVLIQSNVGCTNLPSLEFKGQDNIRGSTSTRHTDLDDKNKFSTANLRSRKRKKLSISRSDRSKSKPRK